MELKSDMISLIIYQWPTTRFLARDQSASLEDWQKLARTGEIVWFYNGRDLEDWQNCEKLSFWTGSF